MKVFRYNSALVFLILLGLVAALAIGVQRHQVELESRQVDLAVDYEGLLELAEREGLPPEEVMRQAKEAGITSLAVYETTFKKLNANGKAFATAGSAVLEAYHGGTLSDPVWRELVDRGKIQGNMVYVTGHDARTYREVREDLLRRLGPERVEPLAAGGQEILAVKAHYESFLKMNIGMPVDEMEAVNRAGFCVIARPSNYQNCSPEDVQAVFRRLDGIRVSEVVCSGPEILGAPKALQATADAIRERNLVLGLIEDVTQLQFYKQDGMWDLARLLGYDRIARLYSIPKDEQPKLKLDTAVERWSNTDQERNIRIDLLRIYEKPAPGMSLLETNMKYFRDTAELLRAKGFTLGPAGTFEAYYPSRFLRALVVTGVAAAGVLYLSLVIPWLNARRKWQWALFFLCALLAAVPVLMGSGSKIRLLAAFASANLFPALAITWQMDRLRAMGQDAVSWPKLAATALVAFLATSTLSLAGAAYLSGALSDVEYFLEFSIFRGIKLTFVLPLVLVAVAFLQRFDVFDGSMDDAEGAMNQLKKMLDMPVRIKTFLGLLLVMAAGIVLVARSGHTSGMPVSGLEIRFRAFLEQAFYARPRSKEILIGHPAFLLAVMAWRQKWPTMAFFLLIVVAAIGQGSMVETFAHMRTPIYMSVMRGIGGILLGAGIGAAAMMLAQLWQRAVSAAKGSSKVP